MDRAERRRRTARIRDRRFKELINDEYLGGSSCELDFRRRGRCKKISPWDCGDTRCFVCDCYRRWFGITREELRALLNFEEQIDDLLGG